MTLWVDNIFLQLIAGQNLFEEHTFTQRDKNKFEVKEKKRTQPVNCSHYFSRVWNCYFAGIVMLFSKIYGLEVMHNLIPVNTAKFNYFGSWKKLLFK